MVVFEKACQESVQEGHVSTIFQKLNRLVLFLPWEPPHFYAFEKSTLQIHKFMNPFFMCNDSNPAEMGKSKCKKELKFFYHCIELCSTDTYHFLINYQFFILLDFFFENNKNRFHFFFCDLAFYSISDGISQANIYHFYHVGNPVFDVFGLGPVASFELIVPASPTLPQSGLPHG